MNLYRQIIAITGQQQFRSHRLRPYEATDQDSGTNEPVSRDELHGNELVCGR
jgi:hypothetical protein